jgi:hypothetical protein
MEVNKSNAIEKAISTPLSPEAKKALVDQALQKVKEQKMLADFLSPTDFEPPKELDMQAIEEDIHKILDQITLTNKKQGERS